MMFAALWRLPKVNGDRRDYSSNSTRTTFITCHGVSRLSSPFV